MTKDQNMTAYTQKELDILEYIVDNFNISDYKFLSVLLRDEFNNKRTIQAYLTRLYKINNGYISKKVVNYSDLQINNKFLKQLLEPKYTPEPTKWEFDPGYPQELIIMDHNVTNISVPSKTKPKLEIQESVVGFNIKYHKNPRKRRFSEINKYNLELELKRQRDQLLIKLNNREMENIFLKKEIQETQNRLLSIMRKI